MSKASRLRAPFWMALVCAAALALRAADQPQFGFTGPEIFPVNDDISLLHTADMDGDGLTDIVVVDNLRSKIDILYNRTGKTNVIAPAVKPDLNQLPPDARFRIESVPSEKRISALVVADLNGDGRPDLAYYGEPKELIVQYNLGSNNWSPPKRWPIDDGQLSANALCTGDLHGSGRPGLILLGENNLYYLAQNADHTLGQPEKIPFSGTVHAVQTLDINGDGRDDLLLVNWDSPDPFRIRMQGADGELGPEIFFPMMPIRAYLADDLDNDHKTELITIAQNSGRAQVSDFVRAPADPISGAFSEGQLQVMPLNRNPSGARRGILWADLNGDGLPDLLVAEPDSGQITLYLQKADGSFAAPKTFSSLTGISEFAAGDWTGDGKPVIFMLSLSERQVGFTRLDENGRIPFPTILPLDGAPATMTFGSLKPGAKPTLEVVERQETNWSVATIAADQKIKLQKLAQDFPSTPTSMVMHTNENGLTDLLIVVPGEKFKALIARPGSKTFEEQDITPPGGSDAEPWLGSADIDGSGKPDLLVAEHNFIRAVTLAAEPAPGGGKPVWAFHVKEQINGASSDAHIIGAAAIRNGMNATPSLFLLDANRKSATLCERDAAGVWQVVRDISLPYGDFSGIASVRLGGASGGALAFAGQDAVGLLALGGDVWQLQPLDSYDTPIPDGHLTDVVSGDLNNDGRKDLVFLETAKNYLDLVTYEAPHNLVPATRWQVFEERTFRSRRNDSIEPREAAVADVTGDGKNDLIVIVHDRILVYPQE